MYAEIIPELSIDKILDYEIPQQLESNIKPGLLVKIPLRNHTVTGYVVRIKDSSDVSSCLLIESIVSKQPVLTEELFQLALWISSYYITPLGKTIKTMLPSGVRKGTETKKQYFITREKSREELASTAVLIQKTAPAQAAVLSTIVKAQKGMLLSELLEESSCQADAVKALIHKKLLSYQLVKTDESILRDEEYFYSPAKQLREEQQKALDAILQSIQEKQFCVKLLHGVTGSGKTEIYMQAISETLAMNKTALMLVPEISLTSQTTQRFKSRFREKIAVIHHRISEGNKNDIWQQVSTGECKIVIGARSAIFSPLPNIGLIIIDEEHEHSYKNAEDSPPYNARDVAVMRGKIASCPVILGTATPSCESYQNAVSGKYQLLLLKQRPANVKLPQVQIVDMRKEYEKNKGFTIFSSVLLDAIEKATAQGEQALLFLNRRGYHTTLTCAQCKTVVQCPHCSCSLTFHKTKNALFCHLCGLEMIPPRQCPSCKAPSMMKFSGIGTEKIESMLHALFPERKILRADADSTRHKGSLEKIFTQFRTGKADILLGTQMIAKGLHFPEVTVVGVLQCDPSLNIPDFRAQESVFQLIMQVSGRAGRGLCPGTVFLQTSFPENDTIQKAAKQDYESFFASEAEIRKQFLFPPFSHIVKLIYQGEDPVLVEQTAQEQATFFQTHLPPSCLCHPALPCGHAKISDKYRFQVLLRGPSVRTMTNIIPLADKKNKIPSQVARFCDVDPLSTFF